MEKVGSGLGRAGLAQARIALPREQGPGGIKPEPGPGSYVQARAGSGPGKPRSGATGKGPSNPEAVARSGRRARARAGNRAGSGPGAREGPFLLGPGGFPGGGLGPYPRADCTYRACLPLLTYRAGSFQATCGLRPSAERAGGP